MSCRRKALLRGLLRSSRPGAPFVELRLGHSLAACWRPPCLSITPKSLLSGKSGVGLARLQINSLLVKVGVLSALHNCGVRAPPSWSFWGRTHPARLSSPTWSSTKVAILPPATEELARLMGSSALLTPLLNVPVTQKIGRTLAPEQGSARFLQSVAAFSTSLS